MVLLIMKSSRLSQLLDAVEESNDYQTKYVLEDIHKKFKSTERYEHVYPEELNPGDIIRYVDANLTKLSTPGIVTKISRNFLTDHIRSITLCYRSKRRQTKYFWNINPMNKYLFKIERGNKIRGFLEDLLNEDTFKYEVDKLMNKRHNK